MMHTFRIQYEDNSYQSFEHIIRVQYFDFDEYVTVQGDEILQHNFPIGKDMYLFAENAKYSASGKNAKFIYVFKEG